MASFTIHSIEPELDEKLTAEAKRRNTSKNRLVKELLARSLGMRVHGEVTDDYREFCGLWSAEEHAEFMSRQEDNACVDAGDWDG